ncbi:MAG: WD40 repeat domain-containing protein [Spirochaetales bacterium]|nr:WD40 repeat domain-containing protein [Spirochaetales bacterium]
MKKHVLAFAFFISAACFAFAQPSYLVQTGHCGPVNSLAFHPTVHALVTAGEDGMVKVWETGRFTILFARRTAPRAVSLLAVHPVTSRFAAAFESDGKYKVSVWDWTDNRELYSVDLPQKPLFVDFSPRGTYLAVCVEAWNSLKLFNAEKGNPIDFPASGSGIISYATFSSRETTIMTYQPSGKITYYELSSAKKIGELKSRGGLVPVALMNNKRSLVCMNLEGFVFLDAVSGKQSATADIPGLIISGSDQQGATIASLTRVPGGRETITVFSAVENAAKELYSTVLTGDSPVTALVAAGETDVYAGTRAGEIFRIMQSGARRVVKNALLPVSDLALCGDKLVLAAPDRLLVLKSDFFAPDVSAPTVPSGIEFATFTQPFAGNRVGLAFHQKNGLFIWRLGGDQGALNLLNAHTFSLMKETAVFSSALRSLSIGDSYYLSIEQSGVCKVNGLNDPNVAFEYQTAGLNNAVFIPPGKLVLGRSNLSSYESSLAIVAGRTGETTYPPEPDIMVYDLAYDDRKKNLYYAGIEKIRDTAATVVKVRSQDLMAYPTAISAKPGRFLFADLACDSDRGLLYFSIEDSSVSVWDGSSVLKFEDGEQKVRKIVPSGNTVYALNDDASITAWNASSRLLRFILYVFGNGAWLLITRNGHYCSGGGAIDRYLQLTEGGNSSADLLDRYRLGVPVTNYVKDSP